MTRAARCGGGADGSCRTPSLSDPVHPLLRALAGRLVSTVRRHSLKQGSLFSLQDVTLSILAQIMTTVWNFGRHAESQDVRVRVGRNERFSIPVFLADRDKFTSASRESAQFPGLVWSNPARTRACFRTSKAAVERIWHTYQHGGRWPGNTRFWPWLQGKVSQSVSQQTTVGTHTKQCDKPA